MTGSAGARAAPLANIARADASTGALVPVHPEPVADDERTLRWIMPAGTLSFVGAPSTTPSALRRLLDDGTIDALSVEPTAVRIRLGGEHGWRAQGARVRDAVQDALAHPAEWSPEQPSAAGDVLRMAAQQVIDGDVGDYVRSHGGVITVLGVADDVVEVALTGACGHCPASRFTLGERFETALRARYPALREVRSRTDARSTDPDLSAGRPRLPLLGPPRR